jgi:hypothetical protein
MYKGHILEKTGRKDNPLSGMFIFPKNIEATSKFEAPTGYHEASSILRSHKNQAPPNKGYKHVYVLINRLKPSGNFRYHQV